MARHSLGSQPPPARGTQSRSGDVAGLDVFAEEPLPTDSPFRDLPTALITPHTAGSSPTSHARLMGLFYENVRRYLAGEELLNVVDKGEGY